MNGHRAAGFYEIPEVARFLRAYFSVQFPEAEILANVTAAKLGRWVRAGIAGPAPNELGQRKQWVDFHQLVSLQIVAALRGKGLTMRKVRRAQEWLAAHTGHPVPFATEDIWTDRNNIFAEMSGDMTIIDHGGQLAFAYVHEHLIKVPRLTFDEAGAAATWEPIDRVLVDPNIQFGAPCIKGTRIQTWVLADLARHGESDGSIYEDYGVTLADIEAAVEWEALTTGQSNVLPVSA